jgi:GAF domain-containing protein
MPLLASPSRPLRRRGRVQARPTSILTDGVPARSGGPGLRIPGAPFQVILWRVEDLLRELSRVALVDRTMTEVLTDITRIAARGIPGAESTSITLLRNEKAFTAAHYGDMALAADELQYARGSGPCMDAGRGGVLLRVDDMRAEERWPDYVAHVVATTPVRSSLSVPLPYQGNSIGALNNYSSKPNSFSSPKSVEAGREVAEVVAVAVANADAHWQLGEQARNMRIAMDSRAVIEQAKGVLMAQRHVNAEEAFEILREASQRYNRKLREIAQGIVDGTQN